MNTYIKVGILFIVMDIFLSLCTILWYIYVK